MRPSPDHLLHGVAGHGQKGIIGKDNWVVRESGISDKHRNSRRPDGFDPALRPCAVRRLLWAIRAICHGYTFRTTMVQRAAGLTLARVLAASSCYPEW